MKKISKTRINEIYRIVLNENAKIEIIDNELIIYKPAIMWLNDGLAKVDRVMYRVFLNE